MINRPHHYQKHGASGSRLYRTWRSIKCRCYNENRQCYKNYGERNIQVCDEWLNSFQAFYDWAINNGYKENLTIDRIDPNGNYEPGNCRWATNLEQPRNKRSNKKYTIKGETHCLKEWCEILNLKYTTIKDRVNKLGWSIEEALGIKERRKRIWVQ